MSSDACEKFLDDLAAIVDGDDELLEAHLDHLADCDACRDARHEATEMAARVAGAGADYAPPEDMEARVLAAIDAEGATSGAESMSREAAEPAAAKASAGDAAGGAERHEPETAPSRRRSPWEKKERTGSRGKLILLFAAAAAVVAAVGIGVSRKGGGGSHEQAATADIAGNGARLTRIERAASDGLSGVEARAPGADAFTPVALDAELVAGTTVRTDERTRAEIAFDDGSAVTLNHLTEISADATVARRLTLATGELVADIAHIEGAPPAVIETPSGRVEVLGTEFDLSASDDFTSVRVTRGLVKLYGASGAVEVRPGEEGTVSAGAAPSVAPAVDLAGAVAWSELGENGQTQAEATGGIGELRAYRPGEKRDKDWPLTLARHKVTVRIVGNVARTEVEETFRNDSKHTLEGVYKFPMPPDAKIDRLALDVKDGFEEGAFVDKERAAKIWRGVIAKAAPKQHKRPTQEIIWVPGPWRDPALLEWQRGGRFELRVFPIPKNGTRTIKLGYTQTIQPQGERRRYVYPLAHSKDQSTSVEEFDIDVRVSGADPDVPVKSYGYQLTSARDGDATRLAFSKQRFVPKGNLIVEYQLPDSKAELRAWTFQGDVAAAPSDRKAKKRTGVDEKVVAAQKEIAADSRPFVFFALRPTLPRWTEARPRDYVIVVDSSQSMVGERFARAAKLAAGLVAEMDRRDRYQVMACDVDCRTMRDEPASPSSSAAREVAEWLGAVEPAGATDLLYTLERAAHASPAQNNGATRDRWVLYVGDGMSSVGHRRAAAISSETAVLAREAGVSVTTVGIGGDADAVALSAIARAGGGHYVPWVPGQGVATAALSVLETSYGVSLRNPRVKLPAGLVDVAPAELPTLRAGNELLIAARFTGEVKGDVILEGTVGGKPFLNRYPIALHASTARGNAFVPRMWAALTVDRLELAGRGEDRARIVALSKAFGVLSRHTSLLVLESEAMFKAFDVDRGQPSVRWTGEEGAEVVEADGVIEYGDDGAGKTRAPAKRARMSAKRPAMAKAEDFAAGPAMDAAGAVRDEAEMKPAPRPRPTRGRGWRRMKRVWFRTGKVLRYDGVRPAITKAVADFEAKLAEEPNSRERHRALVQALSYAGDLDRAYQVAEAWLERDRLDPQALGYMADILGRKGEREQAIRMLTGVVDLEPDSATLHRRLALAYDRIGATRQACSHRIALAEIEADKAATIAEAVRCERAIGDERGADLLLRAAASDDLREAIEAQAAKPTSQEHVRGQLVLDATWSGATDVDLTLVTPTGTRLSWMGGRTTVRGDSAADVGRERLALRGIPRGKYLVEVSRTREGDATPVRGNIRVRLLGKKSSLPFELSGDRKVIGRIEVRNESRLEPF